MLRPVAETIPLPALVTRRLWKVRLVDNMDRPTVQATLLIRRCPDVPGVLKELPKMPGYEQFVKAHEKAEIASVELAGITEN